MAEEKFKKEIKLPLLLEDQRFIQKYGLPKIELEKQIQENLKFDEFFLVAADYLIKAKSFRSSNKKKESNQSIEIAKYVLLGCEK